MDQISIGKFIAKMRKEKNMTQNELAEKMLISDRAISKWENGVCMPDVSNIIELCKILDITINDLFSGKKVGMKEYNKKADENLLELAKIEEFQNKKMLMYEMVIGLISSITFIILMLLVGFAEFSLYLKIAVAIIAFIIFIVGISFALKIETEAGYYECGKCHHRYIPNYKDVYFSAHLGTTRYLKCPKCNKKSWNKKKLTK